MMDNDLLERVEKQRLELETSVGKLRKALKHWQTLELDYEGLKDEFSGLHENASKQECLNTAHDFEPHKVDKKEINDLIEPSRGKIRRPSQIVEVLSKRVDYVTTNITSLRKQIAELEKQRNALLLAESSEHEDDAGPLLAELTEELDDDGNVLSSKVVPQGETVSKILDTLDKSKVPTEDDSTGTKLAGLETQVVKNVDDESANRYTDDSDEESINSEIISEGASKASSAYPTNSDDTEEEAQLRREMLQYGLGEVGNIVAELEFADGSNSEADSVGVEMEAIGDSDDDEFDDSLDDEDDSETEDGRSRSHIDTEQYRREMEELQKQLGLQNLGPTPEQDIDVREHIEHPSASELKDYLSQLPPGLRQVADGARPPMPAREAARKAAVARYEANRGTLKDTTNLVAGKAASGSKKKRVAFASDLDIADNMPQTSKASTLNKDIAERTGSKPSTTNETVIERTALTTSESAPAPVSSPGQPSKPSRFKASRTPQSQAQPQDNLLPPPMPTPTNERHNPEGPPGRTIAEALVERPSPQSSIAAAPPDADDFDEDLQKRQIALEYHRLRNRMVHEQGGYVRGGELENWGDEFAAPEVEDEKTGQVRKISRFKAARLQNG